MNCNRCGLEMKVISLEDLHTEPKSYRISHKCSNKKCNNNDTLIATYTIADIEKSDQSQE
jgi:hypothetical protein